MTTGYLRGGDKLSRRLDEIARNVETAHTLRVGFLEGALYPSGTPVAAVAAFNDFGVPSRNIPSRPFFRNMIAREQDGWPALIATELVKAGYDARTTLIRVGEKIKGQLKDSIVNGGPYAPLSDETIRRKGFSTPLIDTSHMLNSVDKEVE